MKVYQCNGLSGFSSVALVSNLQAIVAMAGDDKAVYVEIKLGKRLEQ